MSLACHGYKRVAAGLLAWCCCAVLLCAPAAAGEPVAILPQWEPQAQFAGLYMAEDLGLFQEHGLDATVLRGGAGRPPHLLLARGEADFATMFLTTAVKLASQGEEIVNLAQMVRRSSLLLVARKSDGILKPADLDGRRISTWGPEFSLQIDAFLRMHGLKVETLPQGFSVNLFLRGGVDAVSAMWYNEYHAILNSGLNPDELTVFPMAEYGLSFPEDGLYCLRSTYERDPETACSVASAVLEGWRLAFERPQQALDAVMRRVEAARLSTNRVHQRWMLERMQDLMAPDGRMQAGELTRQEFMAVAEAMRAGDLIGAIPDYEAFHVRCRSGR